ncbi:hypothetical protein D3C79_722050 [compost metagenome]
MAAGRGDGQLAVRLQAVIDRGAGKLGAAVHEAGRRQDDGLLGVGGEVQIPLAADEVLRALLPHEADHRLLSPQVEDEVDPGHATETGLDPVQLLDEVVQGDGGEQGLGEGEKAVIPDGGNIGQRNGTHIQHSGLALYLCGEIAGTLQSATTINDASANSVRCYN